MLAAGNRGKLKHSSLTGILHRRVLLLLLNRLLSFLRPPYRNPEATLFFDDPSEIITTVNNVAK